MTYEIRGLLIGLFFGAVVAAFFDASLVLIGAGMGIGALIGLFIKTIKNKRK